LLLLQLACCCCFLIVLSLQGLQCTPPALIMICGTGLLLPCLLLLLVGLSLLLHICLVVGCFSSSSC
jgi:hypothetical protein